ncbi:MAG: TonB-dependent receptor [Bacteroidales bacterium]|nr:TonB-dependent receptor [Bacteroidales bacterium]
MNKLFFITLAVLLSAMSTSLRAQELRGRVTADGKGVEYANIGVVSSSAPYGCVTDSRGLYRMQLRSTDSLTIRVSCTGFEPQVLRVCVGSGEVRTLDIALRHTSTQLQTVEVTDDRIRSSPFTQIDIQRIENTVGPTAGVEALLKTLPDVSSNNELSSQYSVRGGSFDENLVYINGVEVYRPQLIRSGQQEGVSVINPDMVDHILFSPGGFDATYGDRMSSALDITYSRPLERKHHLSLSLLGGSAWAQGCLADRFSYSIGFRQHSNKYLFRSLDTEGQYSSSYTDLQAVLGYKISDRLDLSLLAIGTRNRYSLVPFSATTTFGSFTQSYELRVYFDGLEVDQYNTLLGSLALDYHPNDDLQLRWITSAQQSAEKELYDIQDQYMLYEVGVGEQVGDTNHFDRGVGTFLEHARNRLNRQVYSTELRMVRYALAGSWHLGIKAQAEHVADRMREWKWVDSAGYTFPTEHHLIGVDDTLPLAPLLQLFCNADNQLANYRAMAYAQRQLSLFTRRDNEIKLVAGMRGHYYRTYGTQDGQSTLFNSQLLLSPRLSASYKPHGPHDLLYRLTAGIYQQPNIYRELRRANGTLRTDLPAQCSYQATASLDWNLRLWEKPFRLTADIYYKYITHLVPYTIDNLRIRYNPDQEALGYAAGISLRAAGELSPGLESWASMAYMKTQEDILGDALGWLSRPTDQRFSFKIFLQDYMPTIPCWRMSLSLIYGTGTPVTYPYQKDRSVERRLPPYFRVDWGNAIQLTRFERIRNSKLGRLFDDLSLGIEVFNLFDYHNVVSFLWVADYSNIYYPVPNYLTARQLNVKLNATF